MKSFLMLVMFILAGASAFAAPQGVGVGVILGEPTGLSFKTWLGPSTAIDGAAAWSFVDNSSFQLHADYLVHPFEVPKPPEVKGSVSFYYGIGGLFESRGGTGRHEDEALVGVRFPLGVSHLLASAPIEFFAEFVPVLDLAPATEADLNGAVGARYYFK